MATYKYLPLNNEQQIEILERAKRYLINNENVYSIDKNICRGLCGIIVIHCCNDVVVKGYGGKTICVEDIFNKIGPYRRYSLTQMANHIIPMFTRKNAILSNTCAIPDGDYCFWWSTAQSNGAISNRIDFLNWLIEKLKLQ